MKFHNSLGADRIDINSGFFIAIMTSFLILFLEVISHEPLVELFWGYLTKFFRRYLEPVPRQTFHSLSLVSVLFWFFLISTICCIKMELLVTERGKNIEASGGVIGRNASTIP